MFTNKYNEVAKPKRLYSCLKQNPHFREQENKVIRCGLISNFVQCVVLPTKQFKRFETIESTLDEQNGLNVKVNTMLNFIRIEHTLSSLNHCPITIVFENLKRLHIVKLLCQNFENLKMRF